MQWLREHPYVLGAVVVVLLVAVGAFIVQSRSPVAPQDPSFTWSGGTPISAYQNNASVQQSPQQIAQDVIQSGTAVNVGVPLLTSSSSPAQTTTSNSTDYESLLAQLTSEFSQRPSVSAQSTATITGAYQLIPESLVASDTAGTGPMTVQQEALYNYGNEVGGEIQSFEELHPNEAEMLKDQAEDRTDATKGAAVISLGKGLASIGTFMQEMQDVPPQVQSLHSALAQSYLDIGAKLQLVPQAQSDSAFVQAIESYDDSANTFVSNYAALAEYFSAQGVSYSPQDPGSVFSFNANSAAL